MPSTLPRRQDLTLDRPGPPVRGGHHSRVSQSHRGIFGAHDEKSSDITDTRLGASDAAANGRINA